MYKYYLFDLKRSLFSKVTLLMLVALIVISVFAITSTNTKQLILNETSDSAAVIKVVNSGSFIYKMENVLKHALVWDLAEDEAKKFTFILLYMELTDYWPLSVALLIIIYGYFFLIKEREEKIFNSLLSCPVTIIEYYKSKLFSGGTYWLIFVIVYGIIAILYAVISGGFSIDLLIALLLSLLFLWLYIMLFFLIFIILNFVLENYRNTGYLMLLVIIVVSFLVPSIIHFTSQSRYPYAPTQPYVNQSYQVLAFVSKNRQTTEDLERIKDDHHRLIKYREDVISYLAGGVELEDKLIYLSPTSVIQRIQKTLFIPEMVFFREYLTGDRSPKSTGSILLRLSKYIGYLIGLFLILYLGSLKYFQRYEVGRLIKQS